MLAIEENTCDFGEKIDIQDAYNNFYEEVLKLKNQHTKLSLKYKSSKKKK